MKLTVGFSRSNLIGSKIIALSENRDYSHVFIAYSHPVTKEAIVSHAANGMVHEVSYNNFIQVNDVVKVYDFTLTDDQWIHFHHLNNIYKGSKYSILQIVSLFFLKLFNTKKALKINGKKEFICSEWVYFILTRLNLILDTVSSPDTLTPSDLEKLLNG